MVRHLTRRQTIKGAASTLAIAGGASTASTDRETPEDTEIEDDREAEYPRWVYKRNGAGEWEVALPINIHARTAGEKGAGSLVEEAFTGLSNLRWTRVFPDSTTRAWDRSEAALVPPDHSFRRPRLGDEWVHAHVWEVDGDRAAIHAHLDVIDLTASHFHRGDHYDDAAREVTEQLRDEGWEEHAPYSIDYGVDDEQRQQWGETGDVKVEWTQSS